MFHREDRDNLAVLRLQHGKANAIDSHLLEQMCRELDALEAARPDAVVLMGSGGIFSAGVDLFQILEGGRAYLQEFLPLLSRTLKRLFTFPLPVVAAVNGHALAGGCVLACACDRRIMAEGRCKFGVTELVVGVPFPAAALEIFAHLLPAPKAQELAYSGRMLSPEEALALGLVDALCPAGELVDRAAEEAAAMAKIPAATFAISKRQFRHPTLERIKALESIDAEVLATWSKPETLATIKAFLEKTIGKK